MRRHAQRRHCRPARPARRHGESGQTPRPRPTLSALRPPGRAAALLCTSGRTYSAWPARRASSTKHSRRGKNNGQTTHPSAIQRHPFCSPRRCHALPCHVLLIARGTSPHLINHRPRCHVLNYLLIGRGCSSHVGPSQVTSSHLTNCSRLFTRRPFTEDMSSLIAICLVTRVAGCGVRTHAGRRR